MEGTIPGIMGVPGGPPREGTPLGAHLGTQMGAPQETLGAQTGVEDPLTIGTICL